MAPAMACRSCGAPVLWAQTPAGKAMPLNPQPVPNGNVLLVDRQAGRARGRRDMRPRLNVGGRRLWCWLRDERGLWANHPTPYGVGQEEEAKAYAARAQQILAERRPALDTVGEVPPLRWAPLDGEGCCYVACLYPSICPGLIKFGFSTQLSDRLRSHRVIAPCLAVLDIWPATTADESSVLIALERDERRLGRSEVFLCRDAAKTVSRIARYFQERGAGEDAGAWE